jgi:hypothetical protein
MKFGVVNHFIDKKRVNNTKLTGLTWLIHTLFLTSKWNLYKKLQFWPKNDGKK